MAVDDDGVPASVPPEPSDLKCKAETEVGSPKTLNWSTLLRKHPTHWTEL